MDIEKLVSTFRITLANDGKLGLYRPYGKAKWIDEGIEEIKQRKPEIIKYLTEKKMREQEERENRKNAIAAIDGLAEIKRAKAEIEAWECEFAASFERDFGGQGVGPRPEYDIPAMLARYPRAAAYLRAEEYAYKTNYELSAIGKHALETVIFGDYQSAMEQMDKELQEFSNAHAWD